MLQHVASQAVAIQAPDGEKTLQIWQPCARLWRLENERAGRPAFMALPPGRCSFEWVPALRFQVKLVAVA